MSHLSVTNAALMTAPGDKLAAVTPHDTNDLTNGVCKALWIGVAGDVKVLAADDSDGVVLKAAPVGLLPICARRVYSTGTTATNIVAIY